ncbi:hypothetical protein HPB52_017243 [Rhipicephalus sanguineus]|uniref:ZP domain-containing protein n=1 Tax=Rhipicephalus sanguineus TaxID=34632 RepID=A0A9D4TAY3_RHISA|nr:hypothetical protein HPB52_017243 [Rhipicephalus sanguineus]
MNDRRPFPRNHNRVPRLLRRRSNQFLSRPVLGGRMVLTCEPERFLVRINFTQPFRGVVHAGDKRDNCRIRGNGSHRYTLPVPLNDCSTTHNVSGTQSSTGNTAAKKPSGPQATSGTFQLAEGVSGALVIGKQCDD